MKKRILLIIDSLGIGGAERAVVNLSNGFLQENCNVDIIIIDNIIKTSPPKNANLHVLNFQKKPFRYVYYAKKLHKLIYQLENKYNKEFDLILVNLQKSTRLMRKFKHKNTYHVIRNTLSKSHLINKKGLQKYLKKRKLQKIYNNLNLITLSDGIQTDMINNLQVKPNSIQTINNSINLDFILEQSQDNNSDLIDNDYIVHVGRFSRAKRHDVLIKAFSLANLETKLILVGDGPKKSEIENLIKELNMEDKVVLVGFKKNPYPYIKNARLFVLASDYEGMPNVLIESLSLQTPVVSTNCPSGPSEILRGDFKQYLVETGNVKELAEAMKKTYENPYTVDSKLIEPYYLKTIIGKYLSL